MNRCINWPCQLPSGHEGQCSSSGFDEGDEERDDSPYCDCGNIPGEEGGVRRIAVWFSCGNNSAVAAKLATERFPDDELRIVRCVVNNEHSDNDRFHADVERWIGRPIERAASTEYADCWDVWERRKYMSGVAGAPCTAAMKKAVRWQIEREWSPDYQVFGFSSDETKRATKFSALNPEVRLLNVLIDAGISKPQCAQIIRDAGIALPVMYGLGFKNNNCIGCVKATSPAYWANVRAHFPGVFDRMAGMSRRLNCRLTRIKGKRVFIDEIPVDFTGRDRSAPVECGVLCGQEAA